MPTRLLAATGVFLLGCGSSTPVPDETVHTERASAPAKQTVYVLTASGGG